MIAFVVFCLHLFVPKLEVTAVRIYSYHDRDGVPILQSNCYKSLPHLTKALRDQVHSLGMKTNAGVPSRPPQSSTNFFSDVQL